MVKIEDVSAPLIVLVELFRQKGATLLWYKKTWEYPGPRVFVTAFAVSWAPDSRMVFAVGVMVMGMMMIMMVMMMMMISMTMMKIIMMMMTLMMMALVMMTLMMMTTIMMLVTMLLLMMMVMMMTTMMIMCSCCNRWDLTWTQIH